VMQTTLKINYCSLNVHNYRSAKDVKSIHRYYIIQKMLKFPESSNTSHFSQKKVFTGKR